MTALDMWSNEIETALGQRSDTQRSAMLRQMTDLFLNTAASLSDSHVAIFDDVMMRLVEHIENAALVELSNKLAPLGNAPVNVIGHLSRSDDIEVSRPVLEKSSILSDPDLIEIAQTKSQEHLSAIAGRRTISALVTTVLIGRGNHDVALKVAGNNGAHISSNTYLSVLKRARGDEALTAAVAGRRDLPQDTFEQLVREATETVRQRLIAKSAPEMRERISNVLKVVSAKVAQNPGGLRAVSGGAKTMFQPDAAQQRVQVMRWARANDAPKMIEALSLLCSVPARTVNELARLHLHEGIIILGKAGGMSWPELQDVLPVAIPGKIPSAAELKVLFDKYAALSAPKAQIAASFLRTAKFISRSAISALM
jgi:hypothetical protein